ncbi:LptF/LptG family permease [Desulfobulbus alkaliphilus]|uniref:LptF/LptG family permease n=1 Tax=Desulfobulbus alkaliphilus TaxID=869814 RepID=UPI001966B3F1|nr:LptF/LptG family permease [Desulfobulbus alkaliphilus]MBM9538231.1 LptF/LptG family permease [Desulfobulbus alkaliphilus]
MNSNGWSITDRVRPPLLLYSYIATELLAPFFASFIILYCVFFLIRLIPLLEVVLQLHIGLADFIRLFSYIFPHMLFYVIPMASMAGVIICFTRMTNDREILAFKACGISLRQMLPPVVVIAAAIATLTGFFSIQLIPAGAVAVKQLMFQLAKEKIDKGLKEREFTEALGELVVYVDNIDDQDNWHGVYVSDMRGRLQPLITVAKSGHLEAEMEKMMVTVILEDGTLHSAENQDNQVIRFQRYQLQIPLQPPTRIGGEDVTVIDRGAMTQEQLLAAAALYGPDSKQGRIFRSTYHHRLALPVGCFLLSMLGMPLGLQAAPGKRAIGLPLGLACFLLYYITFTVTRVMAEDGVLPFVFSMWLPNMLLLILTVLVFHRTNQEKQVVPERVQVTLEIFSDRFILPLIKYVRSQWRRKISRRIQRKPIPTTGDQDGAAARPGIRADGLTGIFHLPECAQYHSPRCSLQFKDASIAQEAGFKPCEFCKGILEQQNQ